MPKLKVKVVLCGDGAVGKTALRLRYMGKEFTSQYLMTIGADFAIKEAHLQKNETEYTIKYSIWDLTGQSRFKATRELYYKGTHAVILVYDITNRTSYNNTPSWMEEITKQGNSGRLPVILLGNKKDLRNQVIDALSIKDGYNLARQLSQKFSSKGWHIPILETSAKTGENVDFAFESLGNLILKLSMEQY